MKRRLGVTVVVAVVALVGPLAVSASASTGLSSSTKPGHSWGRNQACLVEPNGTSRCYATLAAMRSSPAQKEAAAAYSCPVTLYSGASYSGRALELTGQGYWINLADYGFNNATVSFQRHRLRVPPRPGQLRRWARTPWWPYGAPPQRRASLCPWPRACPSSRP